jgi:hypothetical protein
MRNIIQNREFYHQGQLFRHPLNNEGYYYRVQKVAYFLVAGWSVGGIWVLLGYFFCLTIIFLPLGLFMLVHATLVLTLRYPHHRVRLAFDLNINPNDYDVRIGPTQQLPLVVRAIYFVFFGLWAGGVCCVFGYLCCLFIFIPLVRKLGAQTFEQMPTIMTWQRS